MATRPRERITHGGQQHLPLLVYGEFVRFVTAGLTDYFRRPAWLDARSILEHARGTWNLNGMTCASWSPSPARRTPVRC